MSRQAINFFVNGQAYQVDDAHAFTSLSQFLRERLQLVGTKIVCAEGDCGACSVLLGRPDPAGNGFRYRSVDSCIVMLPQVDGTHVVTVEGLAQADGRLSPVQQAMVDCHGSQCGFCTPGFVTTIHGLVEELPEGGSRLDRDTASLGLSGNLCRCTGYEQILEACDSIEATQVQRLSDRYDDRAIAQELYETTRSPALVKHDRFQVMVAKDLPSALQFKRDHPEARILSGCTDVGVQRTHGRFHDTKWLVINSIDSLQQTKAESDDSGDRSLTFGSATTWTDVLNTLDDCFIEFDPILKRFGSPQIRNIGSIGGNLVNASPIADSIPFLFVAEAILRIESAERGPRSVPIVGFYRGYKDVDLEPDEIVTAVTIPLPRSDEQFKLYKFSKRRDMDISTLTAAFRLRVIGDRIEDARVALGGVAATVLRMRGAEQALVGKSFDAATFQAAGNIAADSIQPLSDVRGAADYRRVLARNVFMKCFHDLTPAMTKEMV
ncbi:MAG: FAD binding domain-containing protein [Planctomycetota bacterium]